MTHTFDIRIGSVVSFEGSHCTVIELAGDAVVLVDGSKRVRRVRNMQLLRDASDAFGLQYELKGRPPTFAKCAPGSSQA